MTPVTPVACPISLPAIVSFLKCGMPCESIGSTESIEDTIKMVLNWHGSENLEPVSGSGSENLFSWFGNSLAYGLFQARKIYSFKFKILFNHY